MSEKWICNKCGYETTEKPEHKNITCSNCNKGRFQFWEQCECGKWFHPQTTKQKYCSKDCMYKYMKKGGKRGKHYPNTQRARIAICPVCGKEFGAIHEYKDRKSIYCSKECWSKRKQKVEMTCPVCGKKFMEYNGRKIYCSKDCYAEHQKTLTGDKAVAWQGGKTKESKCRRTNADYKAWRMAVFERDNFKCQCCRRHTRTLEAHHIKEVCNYPELIYDVDNGITLCHECHKETDNYANKAKK